MTPDGPHELSAPQSLDDALRATDALAVVIDRTGRIVAHNRQWLEAGVGGGLDPSSLGVGTDYLRICDAAVGRDASFARRAAEGIRAVLAGERSVFHLDYPCHGPDERRWFTLRASSLAGPGSSVLVSHVDITAMREAEHEIRGEANSLWNLVDPETEFLVLLDAGARVTQGSFTTPLVGAEHLPIGTHVMELVHPLDRERAALVYERCTAVPDERAEISVRGFCSDDGEWRHVDLTIANLLDDPHVGGVLVGGRDNTARLRAGMAEVLAVELMNELPAAAVATDADGIVLSINQGGADMLGEEVDRILGRRLRSFAVAASPDLVPDGFGDYLDAGNVWVEETDIRRRDGSVITVSLQVRPIVDPATGTTGRSYLAIDHTEERKLRETLFHRNHHDPLTGLANRQGFVAHLESIAGSIDADHARAVGLVSLDRFRDINSRYGTALGDAALHAVGAALERCVGAGGLVARLYGDVFAMVTAPNPEVHEFCGDLTDAIASVAPSLAVDLDLHASVGIRLVTSPEVAAVAVDQAVAAAAEVKHAGGSGCVFFDDALRASVEDRMQLRGDLVHATARGEMFVEYQPVVRLDDGAVVGAEALVRWAHPTRGRLAPDVFIPLAEQTEAIHQIGVFVLDDVCRRAARWRALRPEQPMRVAVNLSAAQLDDPDLPGLVQSAMAEHHLDPGSITIELTESMVMDGSSPARRRLAELKALGVRLAIDDFGTGYSSLARFRDLPLDVVKIDRSFVSGAARSPENSSIVAAIIALAGAFGVDVIAEGVETEADGQALREAGCDVGQGFLWSPAIPPGEIDGMLQHPFPVLADATETVAARFDAYTDALRTVQHELATPVAVLNASVSMTDDDGLIFGDMHGPIIRGVHRVSQLVASLDLLDRLDRGTLVVSPRQHDLDALVQQTASEMAGHLDARFSVEAPGRVTASLDPPLVEQVLVNLLTNAVKYSPTGAPVVIATGLVPGWAWMEVRDAGPGIPLDKLGTVWRKFGRLDHSVPGSGIGLYIARGIARAHGGELRYRAGSGGGSVFRLELPVGQG